MVGRRLRRPEQQRIRRAARGFDAAERRRPAGVGHGARLRRAGGKSSAGRRSAAATGMRALRVHPLYPAARQQSSVAMRTARLRALHATAATVRAAELRGATAATVRTARVRRTSAVVGVRATRVRHSAAVVRVRATRLRRTACTTGMRALRVHPLYPAARQQSSVAMRTAGLRALHATAATVRTAGLRGTSSAAVRAAGVCSGAAASAAAAAVRTDLWLREQHFVGRAVLPAQDDVTAAGHARPPR